MMLSPDTVSAVGCTVRVASMYCKRERMRACPSVVTDSTGMGRVDKDGGGRVGGGVTVSSGGGEVSGGRDVPVSVGGRIWGGGAVSSGGSDASGGRDVPVSAGGTSMVTGGLT